MAKKKSWITLGIILGVLVVIVLGGFLIGTHYLNQMRHIDLEEMLEPPENIEEIRQEEEAVIPKEEEYENFKKDFGIIEDDSQEEKTEEEKQQEIDEWEKEWPELTSDIEWKEVPAIDTQEIFNIMLVGQDRRPGEGRCRSDSMILLSINFKTAKVSMCSFQRDSWVQIPGYADNRLNVAYRYGDIPLMYKTYEKNFGLHIDGTFAVDFDGFKSVVDTLGGVVITLTEGEANIVGTHSGENRLNGEQALAYSRIRYLDSEFKRTERQRKVLLSIYDEIKDASPEQLVKTLKNLLPYMSTDLTNNDIWTLAGKMIPILSKLEISTFHAPDDGEYYNARIKGRAIFVPNLKKIRDRLQNEILPSN